MAFASNSSVDEIFQLYAKKEDLIGNINLVSLQHWFGLSNIFSPAFSLTETEILYKNFSSGTLGLSLQQFDAMLLHISSIKNISSDTLRRKLAAIDLDEISKFVFTPKAVSAQDLRELKDMEEKKKDQDANDPEEKDQDANDPEEKDHTEASHQLTESPAEERLPTVSVTPSEPKDEDEEHSAEF